MPRKLAKIIPVTESQRLMRIESAEFWERWRIADMIMALPDMNKAPEQNLIVHDKGCPAREQRGLCNCGSNCGTQNHVQQ